MYCFYHGKKHTSLVMEREDKIVNDRVCVNLSLIPLNPVPKKIILEKKMPRGRYKIWTISFEDFKKEKAIGNIAIIPISKFSYAETEEA